MKDPRDPDPQEVWIKFGLVIIVSYFIIFLLPQVLREIFR
tara:strand:+ start:298 stop:417 length:120 start_codon:yes stop_codon:yes gene_type:complete